MIVQQQMLNYFLKIFSVYYKQYCKTKNGHRTLPDNVSGIILKLTFYRLQIFIPQVWSITPFTNKQIKQPMDKFRKTIKILVHSVTNKTDICRFVKTFLFYTVPMVLVWSSIHTSIHSGCLENLNKFATDRCRVDG